MVEINELIKSIATEIKTSVANTKYDTKITDDEDQRQLYLNKDMSCFFIDVHVGKSKSVNLHFNKKELEVDINYFPVSRSKKRDLYELRDILESTFARNLKVGKRVLHFNQGRTNILRDEIGYWLNFNLPITYHEQAFFEPVCETIMESLETDLKIETIDDVEMSIE